MRPALWPELSISFNCVTRRSCQNDEAVFDAPTKSMIDPVRAQTWGEPEIMLSCHVDQQRPPEYRGQTEVTFGDWLCASGRGPRAPSPTQSRDR